MMKSKAECGMRNAEYKRCTFRTAKGQSTLEYILVIAAILVAVVAAATNLIGPAVTKSMTDSQNVIQDASGKLSAGLGLDK